MDARHMFTASELIEAVFNNISKGRKIIEITELIDASKNDLKCDIIFTKCFKVGNGLLMMGESTKKTERCKVGKLLAFCENKGLEVKSFNVDRLVDKNEIDDNIELLNNPIKKILWLVCYDDTLCTPDTGYNKNIARLNAILMPRVHKSILVSSNLTLRPTVLEVYDEITLADLAAAIQKNTKLNNCETRTFEKKYTGHDSNAYDIEPLYIIFQEAEKLRTAAQSRVTDFKEGEVYKDILNNIINLEYSIKSASESFPKK